MSKQELDGEIVVIWDFGCMPIFFLLFFIIFIIFLFFHPSIALLIWGLELKQGCFGKQSAPIMKYSLGHR